MPRSFSAVDEFAPMLGRAPVGFKLKMRCTIASTLTLSDTALVVAVTTLMLAAFK
jgi:hypothetical protein